jgi:hypothetical protein
LEEEISSRKRGKVEVNTSEWADKKKRAEIVEKISLLERAVEEAADEYSRAENELSILQSELGELEWSLGPLDGKFRLFMSKRGDYHLDGTWGEIQDFLLQIPVLAVWADNLQLFNDRGEMLNIDLSGLCDPRRGINIFSLLTF